MSHIMTVASARPFPKPLLLVEWVDSRRLTNGEWLDWSDIGPSDPGLCVSVGFAAGETSKGITLAPTVAGVEDERAWHVYGGIIIPRCAIIRNRKLA